MQRNKFASRLISADPALRSRLLAANPKLADLSIAEEIRKACIAAWSSDPDRVQRCVAAAKIVAGLNRDPLILANLNWTKGIADITKGKFEAAITALDCARTALIEAGHQADAAETNVARLLALAMLGRYDDAIEAGHAAIPVLAKHGDELAAGKIEMNLSNIVSRRSQHDAALQFCASARKRFLKAGEPKWQAMAENGLANTYSELNDFTKAERFYSMALATAVSAKMHVTEAEIEASMGNLALVRGRYADALRLLELSRRKFDALAMPHQTAIADLEIADIYAEMNLNAEAIEIYRRVSETFKRLKLRSEEARARLNFGRSARATGDTATARKQLTLSLRRFTAERNDPGRVAAMLGLGQMSLDSGDHQAALTAATSARLLLGQAQSVRSPLAVGLLEGEANLLANDLVNARRIFESVLADARRLEQTDVMQIALNLLGKISVLNGDRKAAVTHFKRSIRIVERLRSPLAAEEFMMSFLASRLEPYDNLARLYLAENRIANGFKTIESGRSRSLVDMLENSGHVDTGSDSLTAVLSQVRKKLNSHYSRLNNAEPDEIAGLHTAIKRDEARVAQLTREIASVSERKTAASDTRNAASLRPLQKRLGDRQTLIEFIEIDGFYSAFLVDRSSIRFVSKIASRKEIEAALDEIHFQFGAMRYGTGNLERYADLLKERSDRALASVYDLLIRPLQKHLSRDRLVIVPVGSLFYVPFAALHDGERYLIERFEIAISPSSTVWEKLAARKTRRISNPLFMGHADAAIPLVEDEIRSLSKAFPGSKALTGRRASYSAFTVNAAKHDLIHIACHGQFRADNPMFSSLNLAEGRVTVRDICAHRIKAELVTLSACETGMNKISAGDEILGLARGFLTAGASSLIVSLWTVNDEATGRLMSNLYSHLQRAGTPAASLRKAQLEFVRRGEHPYRWSPFIYIGR